MSTRLRAYVTSLVLLGAVAWPMFRSPPADSYPLSSYPMFSRARPPFADIEHVVAVSRDGSRRPVPPSRVASGEVLQAKVAIARTLAGGRRAARALCTEVASRLAGDGDFADVATLEVRRDRYEVARYFEGAREPVHSELFARCRVGPGR